LPSTRWLGAGFGRHGDGESIQRLGGKPLHLRTSRTGVSDPSYTRASFGKKGSLGPMELASLRPV
jgi:hypothetical protein